MKVFSKIVPQEMKTTMLTILPQFFHPNLEENWWLYKFFESKIFFSGGNLNFDFDILVKKFLSEAGTNSWT